MNTSEILYHKFDIDNYPCKTKYVFKSTLTARFDISKAEANQIHTSMKYKLCGCKFGIYQDIMNEFRYMEVLFLVNDTLKQERADDARIIKRSTNVNYTRNLQNVKDI